MLENFAVEESLNKILMNLFAHLWHKCSDIRQFLCPKMGKQWSNKNRRTGHEKLTKNQSIEIS